MMRRRRVKLESARWQSRARQRSEQRRVAAVLSVAAAASSLSLAACHSRLLLSPRTQVGSCDTRTNGEGRKGARRGNSGAGQEGSKAKFQPRGQSKQHDDTNSDQKENRKQSRNVRVRRMRSTEQWLLWCNERGDFAMAREMTYD